MSRTGRSTTPTRRSSSSAAATGSSSRSISRWTPRPGTKWVYNSGGSQLLSGIIRHATGRFIDDYAREHLFAPLGITDFYWKKTPTGHPDTEGGLYLSADGLARIGDLYLRDGVWNGHGSCRRAGSSSDDASCDERRAGWDYGYQWWITSQNGVDVWAGRRVRRAVADRDSGARHRGRRVCVERVRHARAKPRRAAHRGAHGRAVNCLHACCESQTRLSSTEQIQNDRAVRCCVVSRRCRRPGHAFGYRRRSAGDAEASRRG